MRGRSRKINERNLGRTQRNTITQIRKRGFTILLAQGLNNSRDYIIIITYPQTCAEDEDEYEFQ